LKLLFEPNRFTFGSVYFAAKMPAATGLADTK